MLINHDTTNHTYVNCKMGTLPLKPIKKKKKIYQFNLTHPG